jgi:hypothetical protein
MENLIMINRIYRNVLRSAFVLLVLMSFQATAQAQGEDLVQTLTSQLGISGEQATSGAGALFDYAKKNLSADDFASIAKVIPGMDSLLMMAPEPENSSAMGKASSMLGGADSSLGGMAGLASSFESLGLDADMVSKFVPIVSDYVGKMSGDQAMQLLQGLF